MGYLRVHCYYLLLLLKAADKFIVLHLHLQLLLLLISIPSLNSH